MPPKNPWQHEVVHLNNRGLDVLHPIEQVDADHYSRMEDVKSLQEGTITPRPGTSLVAAVALATGTPIITASDVKNHGDGANNTAYTSSGATAFGNNKLYLMSIFGVAATGIAPSMSSITGGNLTWVQVAQITFNTIASPTATVSVWRGLVTSGATTTTFTYTWNKTVQTGLAQLWEFSNVDTSGTNGSGAIVQSDTFQSDSTAAPLITLNSFGSPVNATFGAFADGEQTGTLVEGSGFTNATMPSTTTLAEWVNVADTTVDCTRTGAVDMGGVAIEIKAA